MIGQTFAVKYPGVFQSMVLADTSSRQPPGAAQTWGDRVKAVKEKGMEAVVDTTLARWLTEPFRNSNKDVTERIAAGIRATPVDGFAGCCEAIAKLDVLDRLKEVDCPTVVIVGEQDQGTPPAAARLIQENIKGAELVIIPDAAHLANINQPEAFNKALLSFYDRVA